jgi:drug/metabolite transporter (DMT)-like permease
VPLSVQIGLICALLTALGSIVGFFLKQKGAVQAPPVQWRRPLYSFISLFRSPWFVIGCVVATTSWGFHVAALALAPISVVQAVIAGGLVLIAYPATRYFGHRLSRREWFGLGLAGAGLAFLAVTVPHAAENDGYSIVTLAAFETIIAGAGCAMFASGILRRGSICHGVVLGLASGLLIGVSNVAIKALTEAIDAGGAIALLSPWTVLVVAGGLGAFFALARGMQLGDAIPVIATASVASNCAAILGGVVVFGDPMGSDALEVAARTAGFVLVLTGAVLMPAPARAAEAIGDDAAPTVGVAATPA